MSKINVNDHVQHKNGTRGYVERIEGPFALLQGNKHRFAIRLLTVIGKPKEREKAHA